MPYRTLLVHVGNERIVDDIAGVAAKLVEGRSAAHLIGLYVIPGQLTYPGMPTGVMSDIIDSQQKRHRENARKIQNAFEKATAVDGVTTEWRIDESLIPSIADRIVEHGRTADLIVLAQAEDADLTFDEQNITEIVLMKSGRPVLIVPHGRRLHAVGKTVLLAWNNTKESARATFDALPVLKTAKSVNVLFVNPPQDNESDDTLAGTEIAASLVRHGVKAEVILDVAAHTGVGQKLLDRAADTGCDLIVMGGYGHSRFREFILGGATRYILEHLAVPVLISH